MPRIALDTDNRVDTRLLAVAPDGRSVYAAGSRSGGWTWLPSRRRAAAH